MGRRFLWSIWSVSWLAVGFLVLGITIWRLHLAIVMPKTQGQVQGVMSPQVVEELPESGGQSYYLATAGEWWWWRSSRDEHEQARRLLKIGQRRLRLAWDLMANGVPCESVAASERAVRYLQIAYDKGGEVEGQWKSEIEWSLNQYEEVLGNLKQVAPDDLKAYLATQEPKVELIRDKIGDKTQ